MSAHRADRPRRLASLAGALVFLAGSNYCLVAGLAGVPMSCLGLAKPATAAPAGHCAKAAAHGGHCPAKPAGADAGRLPPCCVVLVSTATPQVACPPPADAAPLALALPDVDAIAPAVACRAPIADESPPPLRSKPAPPSGRAPPLA